MRTTTNRSARELAATGALFLLALLAACSKPSLPGDLTVADISLGRTLAPDGTIVEEAKTNSFWATDTLYVSVQTEGSAQNIALQARWTGPDGSVVAESAKTISPTGTTITAFEAAPKDGRWKEGDYKVEILVNETSAGTKDLVTR